MSNNKDLQDSGGVRLPHLFSPPSISEVSNDSSRAISFFVREDMENEFLGTWAEHHADDMTSDLNERCKELGYFDICLTCERDCKMVKCKGVQVHCCGYRRRP